MKQTLLLTAKWGWIILSVLLLLITLALFDGSPKSDVDILLGYGLLILTFPIGLLLSIVDGFGGRAAFNLLGMTATTTYMSLATTWFVYTVAGYLQWFVLLPWVIRRLRAKSARRQSTLPAKT